MSVGEVRDEGELTGGKDETAAFEGNVTHSGLPCIPRVDSRLLQELSAAVKRPRAQKGPRHNRSEPREKSSAGEEARHSSPSR